MKHHLGYVISEAEKLKCRPMREISDKLLIIGDNLMDLYTGKLTVDEILSEIQTLFLNLDIISRENFCNWLPSSGYRKVTLSDKSVWVVKLSVNDDQYIHLHPGKRSEFTCRVRGSTLKTVIAAYTAGKLPVKIQQTDEINQIRCSWLNLSPLNTLQSGKGILKLAELFEKHSVNCFPEIEAC